MSTAEIPVVTAEQAQLEQKLVRGLGLRQLTANIFNYTVGSGIFVLPGIVAATLGPPALLAYLLCALIIGLVVMVFAEAGSRVTITGGPYAYVEVGLGAFPGFIAGLLLVLTDISALAAVSSLLVTMTLRALNLSSALWINAGTLVLLAGLTIVNIRGVKSGARVIEVATAAKLLPLLFFIAVGLFFVKPVNLRWEHLPTPSQVASTAGILFFAFAGIEAALLPSGEVRNPSHTVPRAAMLALGLVTLLYLVIQGVALGVLGADLGTDHVAPLATAAGSFAGRTGRSLLLVGAGISMFGWVTGSILAGPRVFFALARDGFLPHQLAAVHERHRTPHIAIVLYSAIAFVLAATGGFERLAVLSNIAAMTLYFLCAISVVVLRRRGVVADGTPFRMPGGLLIPILACVSITWVIAETITRREFIAFGVTLGIGLVAYVIRRLSGVARATSESA